MQDWCSCNYTISHSLVSIGDKIDQRSSSRHVQGNREWGWECIVLGTSVPKTWKKIPWYCEWYSFCIPGHLYGLSGMCEVKWVLIRGCDIWLAPILARCCCFLFLSTSQDFALALGLTSHSSAILLYIRCIKIWVFLLLVSHSFSPAFMLLLKPFFFLTCKFFHVFFHSASFNCSPLSSEYHPIFLLEGTWPFII